MLGSSSATTIVCSRDAGVMVSGPYGRDVSEV